MDAADASTPLPPPPPANLINTIPPELLGEIFAYISLHDADAPLTLGAVCRAFQRVAHTTPQAWTRLHLQAAPATRTPGMSALDEDARWIRKAELWFAMGGTCLVDLRVEIGVSAPAVVHSSSTTGAVDGHGKKVQHLDSTGRETGDVQLLPHVLHEFRDRIAGLELRSSTVDEAQRFFGALYPPGTLLPLPLERLTFHASPDAPHPQAHLRHKHAPATCVSLSHCHFPHLAHLRFVNHPLPDVSAQNLRSLAITYPIRFPPIKVYTVLQILRSAPLLEKLEIEGRVVDSPRHAHPSSSPTVPSSTAHHTPTSSTTSFTTTSTPTPTNTPTHTPPPPHPDLTLITLPHLALLSLRINNLPALLTHLLLPALHTLRIDDLDGKRAGAAAQTGSVLRQVLVRMELPCAGVLLPQRSGRSGRGGLEVLDMCGVAVSGAGGAGGGGGGAGGVDAADAVWAWCFRRMRALRELRASKMDTAALLALITPQMTTTTTGRRTHAEADDVVLPSLQKLVVFDCSNSNSNSNSSSSSEASVSPPSSPGSSPPLPPASPPLSSSLLHPSHPSHSSNSSSSHFIRSTSGPVLKFQLRRPDVHVEYHRMPDPAAVLPPNVDFLELYCHGAVGAGGGAGGAGAGHGGGAGR